MKVPLTDARSSERAEAAMTPMIDVVFLLLIFFLWTASFQAAEALLPSQFAEVAARGTGDDDLVEEDFEQIVIRVQSQGNTISWRINQQPVENFGRLSERLKVLASIRLDLPVVIDPALNVEFGHVIDAYDVARQVGMTNIQFTTRAKALSN
ncbi:MAG: hypothetical protein CMJ80_10335 [Planctomycetaceae bacterium]|nr:hypothetical protein [Planctomycetaceae bacterium]